MNNTKTDIFFDGSRALSYNCLLNMVVGNRGAGKTYWATKWAIKDFIKNGNQFIYLRRYDTEFKEKAKESFFNDMIKHNEFPKHELKVEGYNAIIDGKVAGYFIALSKSKIKKSIPFPKVNKIIFDEFLLDTKSLYHYISDEVTNFLEFYETVARMRELDGEIVRAFLLSNAISVTNPYFLYWGIKLDNHKKYQRFNDEILVVNHTNKDFIELKKNTRFGKLINGTKYGNYAIENKFLRDDNTFIGKKTGNSRYAYGLKYHGSKYGVWIDYSIGKYFVSHDIDPSSKIIFTITMDDHTPNTMLIKSKNSKMLQAFARNYQLGNVVFEDMNIKNVCYEIIRLFLI